MPTRLLLMLAAAPVLGCGDGGLDPGTHSVTFVYQAATALDPAVQAAFPSCVSGVGQTHIHPGWMAFQRVTMTAVGADRWEISFSAVPSGEHAIRISDANVCAQNATGAATQGVTANGVGLVRVVDTPGSGIEPGLAFVLLSDGVVVP